MWSWVWKVWRKSSECVKKIAQFCNSLCFILCCQNPSINMIFKMWITSCEVVNSRSPFLCYLKIYDKKIKSKWQKIYLPPVKPAATPSSLLTPCFLHSWQSAYCPIKRSDDSSNDSSKHLYTIFPVDSVLNSQQMMLVVSSKAYLEQNTLLKERSSCT